MATFRDNFSFKKPFSRTKTAKKCNIIEKSACLLHESMYILFPVNLMMSGRSSVWLERYVRDVEVAGSNPVAPTIFHEVFPRSVY